MIKQMKIGFEMMLYTHGLTGSTLAGLVFFLLGIILYCMAPQRGMGAYFLAVGVLWAPQLASSLAVSNMVRSSEWKKRLETSIPALLNFVIGTVMYATAFLVSGLAVWNTQANAGKEALGLISCSLMLFFIMVYSGAAYKFYTAATIVFMATIWTVMFALNILAAATEEFPVSFGAAALIGYGLVAAGALAQYGIALLVYRRPPSKRAQYQALRKWM